MYAVIETGGKQYRVQPGDIIQIEKLESDVGSVVKFDQVLLVSKPGDAPTVWLGKPYVQGAGVDCEVVGQGRGDKIVIIKMKRRKQYRRTQGHRQSYTQILVTGVANGAGETLTLSAEDKKAHLSKFQCHLTPIGGKTAAAEKKTETLATPAVAAPKKAPAKKAVASKK